MKTPWTTTEDGLLRNFIEGGVSPCAAARRLSRPESSVYRRIETLGLGGVGKPKKQVRKCMCCSNEFMSEGAHNRLCTRCRNKETSPYQP